jgi:ABC-type uncharacterized transport system ATPase subunit
MPNEVVRGHDLQVVADLADRIHVLDHGGTLAEGRGGGLGDGDVKGQFTDPS